MFLTCWRDRLIHRWSVRKAHIMPIALTHLIVSYTYDLGHQRWQAVCSASISVTLRSWVPTIQEWRFGVVKISKFHSGLVDVSTSLSHYHPLHIKLFCSSLATYFPRNIFLGIPTNDVSFNLLNSAVSLSLFLYLSYRLYQLLHFFSIFSNLSILPKFP